MIPIVIQSVDPECRLSTALWRALRPFHSTALIARERIAASSSPPDFLLVEGDFFRVELPGNAIEMCIRDSLCSVRRRAQMGRRQYKRPHLEPERQHHYLPSACSFLRHHEVCQS